MKGDPMSARTVSESAAVSASLAAFLRGVERRAAVFAECQCGDAQVADSALAAAMWAFCDSARSLPSSDWPRRFWSLLLAVPALRRAAPVAAWPRGLAAWSGLGSGARAALLLQLVAGLHESQAAAVLGVAPSRYRLALRRAMSRQADGAPDPSGWRALAEATQSAIRQLPPGRLVHLAQLREAALQRRPPARRASRPASRVSGSRWLRSILWIALAACLLAFAASFLVPSGWLDAAREPRIQRLPLPPAEPPASTFDAQTGVLTERDFELLADADAERLVSDLGFQAWYAAQLATDEAGRGRTDAPASPVGPSTAIARSPTMTPAKRADGSR